MLIKPFVSSHDLFFYVQISQTVIVCATPTSPTEYDTVVQLGCQDLLRLVAIKALFKERHAWTVNTFTPHLIRYPSQINRFGCLGRF